MRRKEIRHCKTNIKNDKDEMLFRIVIWIQPSKNIRPN